MALVRTPKSMRTTQSAQQDTTAQQPSPDVKEEVLLPPSLVSFAKHITFTKAAWAIGLVFVFFVCPHLYDKRAAKEAKLYSPRIIGAPPADRRPTPPPEIDVRAIEASKIAAASFANVPVYSFPYVAEGQKKPWLYLPEGAKVELTHSVPTTEYLKAKVTLTSGPDKGKQAEVYISRHDAPVSDAYVRSLPRTPRAALRRSFEEPTQQ